MEATWRTWAMATIVSAVVAESALAGAVLTINEDASLDLGLRVQALGISTKKERDSDGKFEDDTDFRLRRGRLRLKAGHHEGSSGLFLLDDEGHVRVGAAQFAHGGGGFALHGEESKGATVLYMQDGKGSLRLFDGEGAVTAQFPSKK